MNTAFKRNTILSNNILQRCFTKKYQEENGGKKKFTAVNLFQFLQIKKFPWTQV